MKIENVKQLEENVGKRVKMQFKQEKPITGVLVKGNSFDMVYNYTTDVYSDDEYVVFYENKSEHGCSRCSLKDFPHKKFTLLETIE